MTTLTVNIEDKKTETAIKAVLEAFGLDYTEQHPGNTDQSLTKSEQEIYDRLSKSAKEIKLYREGKIKLQDASEFLNEL
jgi:GTP cyclohydrolase I